MLLGRYFLRSPAGVATTITAAIVVLAITWFGYRAIQYRAELRSFHFVRDLAPAERSNGDTFGEVWGQDGQTLASYGDWGNVITVWNDDSKVIQTLHRPGALYVGKAIAFIANDTKIVTPPVTPNARGVSFSIFDIASAKVVAEVPGPASEGGAPLAATALVASPDQSLLAVALKSDALQPVGLYDVGTWTKHPLPGVPKNAAEAAQVLAFSPDGKVLAAGTGTDVLLYDVDSRSLIRRITVFRVNDPKDDGIIKWLSFSPDGKQLAVGNGALGTFDRNGTVHYVEEPIRILRVSDGSEAATYPGHLPAFLTDGAWSPDGRVLAFVAVGTLYVWKPMSPQEPARALALDSDATTLAFATKTAMLAVSNGSKVSVFNLAE